MTATSPCVAIIGAGPSGFYAAEQLLAAGFRVDLYDVLPTPFGLVRAGVAPDHPKIKSVTRMYEKTARREGFRFFGGVELGADVHRADLLERYNAVVYAVGTSTDRRLGIPGEEASGSYAGCDFVAWYNGHPHFAELEFDLSAKTAVVIGNGNVALDLARMLVLDPDELAVTDTADHAIEAFAGSRVERVIVLGRRGPAQAAFTNPEVRELRDLVRADVIVAPEEVELDEHSRAWLESDAATPTARRNVEMLREYAEREPAGRSHAVEFRFLRSPLEVLTDDDGRVRGLRVTRNRIEPDASGRLQAVPTGEEEVIECGVVLRSIGYRGQPLPEVPFDERRGLIRNDGGRVTDEDGTPLPGEYVVGWIKRGPSGVIGTNKKDAADTVAKVIADHEAGRLPRPADADPDAVESWLRGLVPGLVTWDGWTVLDEHEQRSASGSGRPRVKVVHLDEMASIAGAARAAS